ncbi:MAG: NADH-quinone oxidoreductase subunit H [Candidatus Omnitrophica bacterium]|nr:NADH-quinone oxidoreductase subunit H [Candidatus Omnitrophota bacterium]
MKTLFNYLIFPGFLFSAMIGLLAGWLDRKVTARIQWRVGPPWYQNFTDIIKLSGKETVVPQGARITFLLSPYLGLLGLVLGATILGQTVFFSGQGFTGDLIVVVYLMAIPAIAVMTGASSSANPLASVGASREMKLLLGYELPFILAIITVIVKSNGAIRLGEIINHQAAYGSSVFSLSGAIAFIVALLCVQAKLGFAPFDIAECEQEIMGGTLIEYSGLPLAVFKLTKAVLLSTTLLFLIILFLGKDLSPAFLILKFIMILVIAILIKNTNPRLRIDQALRFFWGPLTILGLVGLVLATRGL